MKRDKRISVADGGQLTIESDVRLERQPVRGHIDVFRGAHLVLESGVQIGAGFAIACHKSIRIGSLTRLGQFCQILDSDLHVAGNRDSLPKLQPIHVGERVHVGHWCTILPGSVIAAGASVASYSVVSGYVPAGAVVSGNPAMQEPMRLSTDGSLEVTILSIFRTTFESPYDGFSVTTRRDQIAEWNSLGCLRLLAALEGGLGITIDPRGVLLAQSIIEVIDAVAAIC